MRPAWRLAINSLAGRRKRTTLLVLTVAFATSLVVAVACGMASVNAGMLLSVETSLGKADIRIRDIAGQRLEAGTLELIEQQPEVKMAAPRARGSIALRNTATRDTVTVNATGIDPIREYQVITPIIDEGRRIEGEGEIVLNRDAANELNVGVGGRLRVERFGPPLELTVVGIATSGKVDIIERYEATLSLSSMERATLIKGRLTELAVVLNDDAVPESAADRLQTIVPRNVVVQTTALVTSGIERAMQARTFGFIIISALANMASAFIVLTGLTTNVLERQRELAIMRCLGAARSTLALSQLIVGAIIGMLGGGHGIPLGILLTWTMALLYPDKLPAGLNIPPFALATAFGGAVLAGVIGASWPAIAASRTSPLSAMTRRAVKPTLRALIIAAIFGLVFIAWQLVIVGVPDNVHLVFWGYITTGMPLVFTGYFLVSAPLGAIVAHLAGAPISRLFGLPKGLLKRSYLATPFRNGFTAAALMVGMAMMTSIWTHGSALLRDWIGAIEFPDAFIHDWNGLDQADIEKLRSLDFVDDACPITYYKIDTNTFAIAGIPSPPSNFIAFEPDTFFRMTKLAWVAGDETYARRRLNEGGAVLVAKEFLIARQGYAIGDRFNTTHQNETHEFEVVGAVSSPGLDLVGYAFDIGKEYENVAIGTVFGTRADLGRVFGSDAIHLIQMKYQYDIDPVDSSKQIREALQKPGVLLGDGREIKSGILEIGQSSMKIASIVAIAAMLIGCLSVGNVVLAGIDARRFEFGILRAIGAGRGILSRLILGEVILIGITACILGIFLGVQGAYAGIRMNELLAGLKVNIRPPLGPIAAGCAILMTLTILVTLPLALRLGRIRIRELLASTRG